MNLKESIKSIKKEQKLAIGITIFTIILLAGLTYTYFAVSVSNSNNEKIQTQTATMSLEFDDGDNGVSGTLNLGQSIIKKFTLENTGTVDAYGKINWYNLVNTYTQDSLTWTLEQSTTENGTYTNVGSGRIPVSSAATTATLKNGLMVPVNTTYYYKLTITLNNLDIDQSSDINAHMNSKFNLEAGTKPGTQTIMDLVSGEPTNTTDVITKTAPSGANCTNTLAYDGTIDNNLRYVGANPCNYVTFNGESPSTGTKWVLVQLTDGLIMGTYETQDECQTSFTEIGSPYDCECQSRTITTGGWKIIGIMNNVDDGTGNLETRIKLTRNDSLGLYSWDSSLYNDGYGVNDWSEAKLKYELNGDYLDTTLQTNSLWYNSGGLIKEAKYDYTKGLKEDSQGLIDDAKWYLGGFSNNKEDLVSNVVYTKERGTAVWGSTSGQICDDFPCPRALDWTGKISLPYPSDFVYATSGGEVTSRNLCIGSLIPFSINDESSWEAYSDCKNNVWLRQYQATISPSSIQPDVIIDFYNGVINKNVTRGYIPVHPTLYLKSDVTISGGNGTPENPYVFS